jgi:hypothetical protein
VTQNQSDFITSAISLISRATDKNIAILIIQDCTENDEDEPGHQVVLTNGATAEVIRALTKAINGDTEQEGDDE